MKAPMAHGGGGAGTGGLASPALIVVLVLLLGATIYLWRARYMRRRTAYFTMAILVIALVGLGAWMYLNPYLAS
jgi:hypothetical protein